MPLNTQATAFLLVLAILCNDHLVAAEWSIPLAGNAYQTAPRPGNFRQGRDGSLQWNGPEKIYSIYFKVSRHAKLRLKIRAQTPSESLRLRASVGDTSFDITAQHPKWRTYEVGQIEVPPGYVKVDLQLAEDATDAQVSVQRLILESDTPDLQLDYVKSNRGNMFYWGRRGPSVHLRYQTPRDQQIQYAYSELMVPQGFDPIGSYFMANGFGEGYFGMQVNSKTERRILFSVWSPFATDNPKDIPKDAQIRVLARGPDVHTGEFGNEGSADRAILCTPGRQATRIDS